MFEMRAIAVLRGDCVNKYEHPGRQRILEAALERG
jgi:hypothetical protein